MALVIANTYKSDAKPPGTSKIYYGPEMTFGAKSVTVVKHRGVIYYRKFTMATGNLLVPGEHLLKSTCDMEPIDMRKHIIDVTWDIS